MVLLAQALFRPKETQGATVQMLLYKLMGSQVYEYDGREETTSYDSTT